MKYYDDLSTRILTIIYEQVFLVVGFVAIFVSIIELPLKVLLSIFLIRLCFSWRERIAIDKNVATLQHELAKVYAVLQGLFFEVKREIEKDSLEKGHPVDETIDARAFVSKIEEYEETFNKSFEETASWNKTFGARLSKEKWWLSALSLVSRIVICLLIAAAIAYWINSL